MFDAEIGLDKGDSINLKLGSGELFVWNDNGSVLISVNTDGVDILHVYVDSETCEVDAVTSPHDTIKVPLLTWKETLRRKGSAAGVTQEDKG